MAFVKNACLECLEPSTASLVVANGLLQNVIGTKTLQGRVIIHFLQKHF